MEKYRIKEEKHEGGLSKFYPEVLFNKEHMINDYICFSDRWHSLSIKKLGFNNNGMDFCFTYSEAVKVMDNFKKSLLFKNDEDIIEVKYYEMP